MSRWLLIKLEPAGPSGFESCGGILLMLAIVLGIPGALIYHGCGFDRPTPEQAHQQAQQQALNEEYQRVHLQKGHDAPYFGLKVRNYVYGEWNCNTRPGATAVSLTSEDAPEGSPASDLFSQNLLPSIGNIQIVDVAGVRVHNVREFHRVVSASNRVTGGKTLKVTFRWVTSQWVKDVYPTQCVIKKPPFDDGMCLQTEEKQLTLTK